MYKRKVNVVQLSFVFVHVSSINNAQTLNLQYVDFSSPGDIETENTSTQTDIILTSQIVSIARNLDPVVAGRLSYLEHSSSWDESETSSNMEKLFPNLRRSKSKESLDVSSEGSGKHKRHRSESGLKKSKSRDDLSKNEPETGVLKFSLKKSKSREELASAKGDKKPPKEKGSRGFMKWNKSKEHVEQIEPSSSKEKKGFLKRHKSKDNLANVEDKPRKSIDSSSDSNKSEPKPEIISKLKMKKREKSEARVKQQTHPKFMSVEEETLLRSLDVWYENIDQSLPDEFLTDEDRAIKKLKILYEDDTLKEKPVAHKPKEYLAISKPLLDSVVLNPKLERIFKDPKLPTVDSEVRQSALEETRSEAEGPPLTNLPKRTLENVVEYPEPSYRAVSYNRMSTDVLPTDSASNPRHSVKYQELPKPNIYINYENLDEIVHKIPPEAGENKLSEEQKFALKLKQALNEAEKKHTLKKTHKKKSMRGQEISAPLRESVEKNWKLKEILMNPQIKIAEEPQDKYEWKRHSTDISSHLNTLERPKVVLQQNSKSYEDISFSFVPETKLLKNYDSVDFGKATTDSSSSRSFTSAEFNLDTGDVVLRPNDQKEDLLYNATINKTKSEKRQSKELIAKMINELAKQEEEDDDEIHHPKIIEAREQYKKELQLALKRLDQDELRRSARKQRLKAIEQSNDSLSSREDLTENEGATRRSFVSGTINTTVETKPFQDEADEEIVVRDKIRHPVPKHRTKRPDSAPNAECVNYRVVEDVPQFNSQVTGDHEYSPEVVYVNLRDAYTEEPTKDNILKNLIEQSPTDYNVIRSQDAVEPRTRSEKPKFEEHAKYGILHAVQAPSRKEFMGFAVSKEQSFHNLVIEEPQPKEEGVGDRNPNFRLDQESPKHDFRWTIPKNLSFHSESIEADQHEIDPPQNEIAEDLIDQNPDHKFTEDYAKYDLHVAIQAPPKEEFTAYVVPKDVALHSLVIEESQPEVERSSELDYQNTDFRFSDEVEKYYHVVQPPLRNEFTPVPNDESLHTLVIEEVTEQPRSILFNPEDSKEYTVHPVEAPETEKHHRLNIEETPLIEKSREDSNSLTIEELNLEEPNSSVRNLIEDASPTSEVLHHQDDKNSLASEEHNPEYSETSNMDGQFIPPPVDFLDEAQIDPELSNKSHYDTLKENQYGVVSPAGVRYTYRNVVKEFKSRYSEDGSDHEQPEQIEDEDVTFENPDDFVDHFFKPVLQEPPAMSMIDKEMQDVIDKYVHDRDSLLNKGPTTTGLKKFDNFENLTKITEVDIGDNWQSAKVVTVIEEQTATLSQDEDTEPLSLEDLHFIEEMKLKYSAVDTTSDSSEDDDKSKRLSEVNEQNLSVISEQTEEPPKAKAKCRIPRPLSGINEQDLLLIEKVAKSLHTIEEPPKAPSRIPIKKQTSEEHLPPSLRPKRPANLPLNRPKSYATTTSSLPQFNKRYSYQEVKDHSPIEDQRSSGRLSDLIFKETIFIPHTQKRQPKESPADKEPKSPDTETIFIAKTTQESPLTPEQTSSKSTVKTNWNRYPTSPSNTWSNSLKKGLLDTPVIAYEPVYSRTSREDLQIKPLPAPRVNTFQATKTSVLTTEMTDTNFSDEKNLNDVKVENLEPGNHAQSQEVILVEQSKAHTNILQNLQKPAGLEHVETKMSNPSGTEPPSEVLESDVEEVPRQSSSNLDTSNVNLFHMDTPPAYDSYMELFRSRESKEFDTLTQKPTQPHMAGFVYVEEVILEDAGASSMDASPSVPKIVDFVPLDDQTTPVFTKPETDRTYDTLEREKTFHVLGQAASIASIKEYKEPEASVELLAKKSSNLSKSSSSRTSFSQAKKLFEALAEANKEEKPRLSGSKPPVNKTRDSKSMEQVPDGAVSKE